MAADKTTSNSVSEIIKNLSMLQANEIEIFQKFSDAMVGNTETVTVDVVDENNNITKVYFPSFGYLKRRLDRIETNLQTLSGVGEGDSFVRLEDGTFKKVFTTSLQREANNIESIESPKTFGVRSNWFFEQFLNPSLYVSYDLTDQVPVDTRSIRVLRLILNLDTPEKIAYYNVNYLNRSDIDYEAFIDDMTTQSISYFVDDDVVDLPLRENRYFGNFNIIKIFDETGTEVVDGTEVTFRTKKYKLNKLTYNDRRSTFTDTVNLQVGDDLLLNDNKANTRFRITAIDTATNVITLRVQEGFDAISVGSDQLRIFPADINFVEARIGVGFDERNVAFIKPIDVSSNIPSDDWSPGTTFYTNDLIINSGTGETLETYYRNEVADFGNYLLSIAKDRLIPTIYGITPDAPTILANNFTIAEVNQHLTRKKLSEEIRTLQQEKNSLLTEIQQLDTSISEAKQLLSTRRYTSNSERDVDVRELERLENDKATKQNLYSSIIGQINTISEDPSLDTEPKYRIRGFWDFPEAKTSTKTGSQEVVQFLINYRYLSLDGDGNPTEQIEFTTTDGNNKTGSFSSWIELKSDVRKKITDSNGNSVWAEESVEDGDVVNINQLDIPISRGEKIQIRIRSLSEAGYPNNPLISEWSDVVEVEFPEDLLTVDVPRDIIAQNQQDGVLIQINSDLQQKGLDTHINDQFTTNEKFFAHTPVSISSGFLSPEQTPISLFDKLVDIDNELQSLRELIEKAKGSLFVKILDDEGNETIINNNTENKFFAGFYRDLVKDLNIKKGVIITKSYFLSIGNTSASELELLSLAPGDTKIAVQESNYILNDFQTRRKYDLVPLQVQDTTSTYYDSTLLPTTQFEQTQQANSQYMYLRYKDLRATSDLYASPNVDLSGSEYRLGDTSFIFTSTGNNFIWDTASSSTAISTKNDLNQIDVHVDHPNIDGFVANANLVRNSTLSNLVSSDSEGRKQYEYLEENGQRLKLSFEEDDQYLLGPGSVGSYLYMSIKDHSDLVVNGTDATSTRVISFGNENAIKIPIVFQFRMTDYWGSGTTGLGSVGGDPNGTINNLTYTKKIGIDIVDIEDLKFSFDLEFSASYKPETANISQLSSSNVQQTLANLSYLLGNGANITGS